MRRASPLPLGDGGERDAARMMGLSVERLRELLSALHARGFPRPDDTTGLFDLDAVDAWRRSRHPTLYGLGLAPEIGIGKAEALARPRFEALGPG